MNAKLLKVAWIRNDAPLGFSAPGHLNCPCGHSPESNFSPDNGNIYCNCGRIYAWNGFILQDLTPETRTFLNSGGDINDIFAAFDEAQSGRSFDPPATPDLSAIPDFTRD